MLLKVEGLNKKRSIGKVDCFKSCYVCVILIANPELNGEWKIEMKYFTLLLKTRHSFLKQLNHYGINWCKFFAFSTSY